MLLSIIISRPNSLQTSETRSPVSSDIPPRYTTSLYLTHKTPFLGQDLVPDSQNRFSKPTLKLISFSFRENNFCFSLYCPSFGGRSMFDIRQKARNCDDTCICGSEVGTVAVRPKMQP